MTFNDNLRNMLSEIESSCAGLDLTGKLKVLDNAINESEKYFTPFLAVHKSSILWAEGDHENAISILEEYAHKYENNINVHYFAGEHLLELGEFKKAFEYINHCIYIIEKNSDMWYASASYLIRAYCAAKLGKFDIVRNDLSKIGSDDSMPWLKAKPVVSRRSIELMLNS